jgi:hypothetical protein
VALAASAALVLLALSFVALRNQNPPDRNFAAGDQSIWSPDLNAVSIGELMSLWNQTDHSDRGWPDDDDGDDESARVAANDEAGDLTVPGWMLAAVESGTDALSEED